MLSKMKKEPLMVFNDLGPTHVSANAVEGIKECSVFFPPGYGEKPKEVVATVKKRRGRVRYKSINLLLKQFLIYNIFNRKRSTHRKLSQATNKESLQRNRLTKAPLEQQMLRKMEIKMKVMTELIYKMQKK